MTRSLSAPTIHQAVAAAARRDPTTTAIEASGRRITFGELLAAAGAVSADLSRLGVAQGDVVAIAGRAVPELLLGMIAILQVGAAFCVLDPADPPARRRAILDSITPAAVVALPQAETVALEASTAPLLLDERSWGAAAPPLIAVQPASVAYVCFTSGSSGRPKGVMVEHRNVMAWARWTSLAFRVGSRVPTLPALTRPSFDASLLQLLAPLLRGEQVWMPGDQVRTDFDRLVDALAGRPGAALHCVPSVWAEVLDVIERAPASPRIAALYLGGDTVPQELWDRTGALLPGMPRANVYGPTETTVQATGGFQQRGAPLSVGLPAEGTVLRIVDAGGAVLPQGETGEVWIGGAQVARGYTGEPALTDARFVRPGWAGDGMRFFRSGDLGWLLPDGSLVLCGRIDDQIKLRGFRIEPGEVETALVRHTAVRRAVVVASGAGATARLRALVVPANGEAISTAALTEHLRDLLPRHMVPDEIAVADEVPLTVNGKVDRRAIAASPGTVELLDVALPPSDGRPSAEDVNGPEPAVLAILAGVLEQPGLQPTTDFFAAGGTSLLATRVASRLRRALGRDVPLRLVFDHPSARELARALDADTPGGGRPEAAGTHKVALDNAPLTLLQQALWDTEEVLGDTPFNRMVLPVRITGPLDLDALRGALEDVVRRQAALRSRIDFSAGEPRQLVLSAVDVPLEVSPASGSPEAAGLAVARALMAARLDPVAGPTVRAHFVRTSTHDGTLLVVVHHLFCDGISLGVIVDDLVDAYRRRREGRAPATAALWPGYAEHAREQRILWDGGMLARHVEHWVEVMRSDGVRSQLGDLQGCDDWRVGNCSLTLSAGEAEALRSLAAHLAATPFLCLAAVLAHILVVEGGGDCVRLATLFGGRPRLEHENLVGLFATTLLLDVLLDRDSTYADAVAAVRGALLDAESHAAVPLEVAAAELHGRGEALPTNPLGVGLLWDPPRPRRHAAGCTFTVPSVDETADGLPVAPSTSPVTVTVRELEDGGLLLRCEHRLQAMTAAAAGELLLRLRDGVAAAAAALSGGHLVDTAGRR